MKTTAGFYKTIQSKLTANPARNVIDSELRNLELRIEALTILRDTIDWVKMSDRENEKVTVLLKSYIGEKP